MESLKNEAQLLATPAGQGAFIELGKIFPVKTDASPIRAVETGDQIEQGRFADAGFAHDRDVLTIF